MITFSDKFDFIDSLNNKNIPDDSDWEKIKKLSADESTEIRQAVGDTLALFPCEKSEDILLSMLYDKDYVVRTYVIDSLNFSKSQKTLGSLQQFLSDKSVTVRGYAALTLGDIQYNIGENPQEIIDLLKDKFYTEKSEWCKIAIARSLCLLGEKAFAQTMYFAVNSRYYKNRCFVLNLFADLPDLYCDDLLNILQDRQKIETALSVKENLGKIISLVGKILKKKDKIMLTNENF